MVLAHQMEDKNFQIQFLKCCLLETHFKYKDIHVLKNFNGKVNHVNRNQTKAEWLY